MPHAAVVLHWSVADDGRGLPAAGTAPLQGNGIAGIRQRVWSHGADLQLGTANPDAAAPGCRLAATFDTRWLPPATAQD